MKTRHASKAMGAAVGATRTLFRGKRRAACREDLLAALPEARQLTDGGGAAVFASPAFEALFGAACPPAPELLAAAADGDQDEVARLGQSARAGRPGTIEVTLRVMPGAAAGAAAGAAEGPRRWRVSAEPVPDRPVWVLWTVAPLSQEPAHHGALDSREIAELLDRAPIGLYETDAEGRLRYANAALARWLGLAGPNPPRDGPCLGDLLVAPEEADPGLVSGAAAGEAVLDLKGPGGEVFTAWIAQEPVTDADRGSLGARGAVRRLTDGLASAGHPDFRRSFDLAPVGIALVAPDGTILECNDKMLAFSGVKRPEVGRLTLADLVAEADRPSLRALLKIGPSPDGDGENAPLAVRMAGAGETTCALHLTPLGDGPGDGLDDGPGDGLGDGPGIGSGFIAHLTDTSELKALEAQFAQSQKMQAVGQLAGGVAHDFNNLLTAMIGFSDLLLLRHPPGDQSFADIMHIRQNANRAAGLVRQLLAFSRQQTLQPRVLDVTDILAELVHLLRRLIGETIELKMIHGRDLGTVKADQGQLEQVIINLVVNARDAMADGGTLTIRTDNESFDKPIRRKGEIMPAGDYCRIQVSDTGCGIAETHLDRIFEPFFSTKEVGAGTGLGLSTVYGIVSQTGGFVTVDSRPGEGTTFSIFLPHHQASEAEPTAREAVAEPSRDLTGMGTVLLVEDEDAVRAFGAQALRKKGYSVLEARSGEAALELLGGREQPVDLLITDVVMPRLDGPSLVREVRESLPALPVIFISGYAEESFRKRLGKDSGIHFLPKPFTLKELAGKVKEVMGEAAA